MGDAADAATDAMHEFYSSLSELKKQMHLGTLAGLYHQWEKNLRDFLEHELNHYLLKEQADKHAWYGDIAKVFDLLNEFGWDCRSAFFWEKLNACRLAVNAYKHRKGASLGELGRNHQEHLKHPFPEKLRSTRPSSVINYEWLEVSEAQFDEIACALRAFWEHFPDRLYYPENRTADAN
jgi:hypothetical protein